MTIRDMERRSGLERANIRFYEREGLLTPERRENGYRDYSEADLELLLKIKLLRRLGFSLEAIRSLKEGSEELEEAIARRLGTVDSQRRDLNATEQVCQEMRQDRAVFSSLDAQRYLSAYDQALKVPAAGISPAVPDSDRVKPIPCPWRRYFARGLDISLIALLRTAVMALLLRVNLIETADFIDWCLSLLDVLLLVPVEALLLSRWGTTPGKWLFGIRLESADGGRLTFGEAARRSLRTISRGQGLMIPFYNLWRLWKSYESVRDTGLAEWDEETVFVLREEECPLWRELLFVAVRVAITGLLLLCLLQSTMPLHRAPLTKADFLENYNQLAKFHKFGQRLQEDGHILIPNNVYEGYMQQSPAWIPSENGDSLQLVETDGLLTEISFHRQVSSFWYGFHFNTDIHSTATLCVMALVWPEGSVFDAYSAPARRILKELETDGPTGLSEELLGWQIDYTVEDLGERLSEGGGWTERSYDVTFSITRPHT